MCCPCGVAIRVVTQFVDLNKVWRLQYDFETPYNCGDLERVWKLLNFFETEIRFGEVDIILKGTLKYKPVQSCVKFGDHIKCGDLYKLL